MKAIIRENFSLPQHNPLNLVSCLVFFLFEKLGVKFTLFDQKELDWLIGCLKSW